MLAKIFAIAIRLVCLVCLGVPTGIFLWYVLDDPSSRNQRFGMPITYRQLNTIPIRYKNILKAQDSAQKRLRGEMTGDGKVVVHATRKDLNKIKVTEVNATRETDADQIPVAKSATKGISPQGQPD